MSKKYILDDDVKQLNIFEERWYEIQTKDETFYFPSVTTYLEAFPKGAGYSDWVKSVGRNADEIMTEAGQKGSECHNLIETVLKGGQVRWQEGITQLEVWEKFLYWCGWFKEFCSENEVVWDSGHVEQIVFSIEHRCAGTIDWAPLVNGKREVFDWKTSKAIYEAYELQIAAYADLYSKQFEEEVSKGHILLLGSSLNKKGWRLSSYNKKELEFGFEDFQHTQCVWHRVNKNAQPKFKQYPIEVDLKFIQENEIITLKGK